MFYPTDKVSKNQICDIYQGIKHLNIRYIRPKTGNLDFEYLIIICSESMCAYAVINYYI